VQAGDSQSFHTHKFWLAQDFPDTHSAVVELHLCSLEKGKKKKGFLVGGLAVMGPQHLVFWGCYVL
jgi:hypothetical protein